MITRYVLTAENDSGDPPDTIHLVYGAESNWRFMAQRGSRDYPITPDGLRFLAHVLMEHGYRVEPGKATDAVLVSKELRDQTKQEHTMAGRMGGASGTVTFCHCGLGFFEFTRYPAWDVERGPAAQREASEKADARWLEHATEVSK